MARDAGAGRALACTLAGVAALAGGLAACRWLAPDLPALLALPVALAAALFLLAVRRVVKPARTGREE